MHGFWSVEEYLRMHPAQAAQMEALQARVTAVARPLRHPPQTPVRIAMIHPDEQVSDYWRRNQRALEGRLHELALPYTLHTFTSSPTEADLARQIRQLEQALADDPDYLIYTLSSPEQLAVIERIVARGRPKVILQNITTPLHRWEGMQPMLYVGFDHTHGSQLLAAYMREHVQGEYVVLKPAPGYLSKVRGDSFVQALADAKTLRLVEIYYTDLSHQRAYLATQDALQRHPDLSAIYASSTDIALGAAKVLQELGRKDVLLNGWGGGSEELQAVRAGELAVTVMRINDDAGVAMAEAITLDRVGSHAVPTIYVGEMVVVDRHTTDEVLDALRARAFRYSDRREGD